MSPVLAQLVLSAIGASSTRVVPLIRPTPGTTSVVARSVGVSCKFSPAYSTTQRYAAADWAKNIRTLPQSIVLKRISSPLLFNFAITSIICALNGCVGLPKMVALPHTLLGSALGLLLVFRTNAAYDRFWEARKMWATVTSECRNFASLACTFMTAQQALPMLSLIAAFPVVLKNYLRGAQGDAAEMRDLRRVRSLLAAEEAEALSSVVNQPQYVLTRLRALGHASSAAGVTEKEREVLLKSATVLGECVSTCERIFNTPIPLAYSRHTSRFLVLYVSTLPLALVHTIGWATLPVMSSIVWALFGILEIGNLIEEPFTAVVDFSKLPLLPLTEVCRTIRRDVRAIATYAQLSRTYNVPTISRVPKVRTAKHSPQHSIPHSTAFPTAQHSPQRHRWGGHAVGNAVGNAVLRTTELASPPQSRTRPVGTDAALVHAEGAPRASSAGDAHRALEHPADAR